MSRIGFFICVVFFNVGVIFCGVRKLGKVVVIGSVVMFDDVWLDKEDNVKLLEFFFFWLINKIKLEVVFKYCNVYCDNVIWFEL